MKRFVIASLVALVTSVSAVEYKDAVEFHSKLLSLSKQSMYGSNLFRVSYRGILQRSHNSYIGGGLIHESLLEWALYFPRVGRVQFKLLDVTKAKNQQNKVTINGRDYYIEFINMTKYDGGFGGAIANNEDVTLKDIFDFSEDEFCRKITKASSLYPKLSQNPQEFNALPLKAEDVATVHSKILTAVRPKNMFFRYAGILSRSSSFKFDAPLSEQPLQWELWNDNKGYATIELKLLENQKEESARVLKLGEHKYYFKPSNVMLRTPTHFRPATFEEVFNIDLNAFTKAISLADMAVPLEHPGSE